MTQPTAHDSTRARPRVFVAMPIYETIVPETFLSLMRTRDEVDATFSWNIVARCSVLELARARLMKEFLASADDFVLWVDGDGGFAPDVVARLLGAEKDIVGALFAFRHGIDLGAVRDAVIRDEPRWDLAGAFGTRIWDPRVGPPIEATPDIVEVDAIGCGLTLVRRGVFEAMVTAYSDLLFEDHTRQPVEKLCGLFHPMLTDGKLSCEDISFCLRAKALGFRTHALIAADTVHYGMQGVRWNALEAARSAELGMNAFIARRLQERQDRMFGAFLAPAPATPNPAEGAAECPATRV